MCSRPGSPRSVFLLGGLLALAVDTLVPGFHGQLSIGLIASVARRLRRRRAACSRGSGSACARRTRDPGRSGSCSSPRVARWRAARPEPYLATAPAAVRLRRDHPTARHRQPASRRSPRSRSSSPIASASTRTLMSTLVFALPMLVLVGEALAFAQARRTKAEARVERLLEAVRILARVDDQRTGAQLVASLVGRAARRRRGRGAARRSARIPTPVEPCVLRSPRARRRDAPARRHARLGRVRRLRHRASSPIPQRVRALTPAAECVRAVSTRPAARSGPGARSAWSSRCGRRRGASCTRRRARPPSCCRRRPGRMFRRLRESAELDPRRRDRSAHPAREPPHVRPGAVAPCSPATRWCSSTSITSSR